MYCLVQLQYVVCTSRLLWKHLQRLSNWPTSKEPAVLQAAFNDKMGRGVDVPFRGSSADFVMHGGNGCPWRLLQQGGVGIGGIFPAAQGLSEGAQDLRKLQEKLQWLGMTWQLSRGFHPAIANTWQTWKVLGITCVTYVSHGFMLCTCTCYMHAIQRTRKSCTCLSKSIWFWTKMTAKCYHTTFGVVGKPQSDIEEQPSGDNTSTQSTSKYLGANQQL